MPIFRSGLEVAVSRAIEAENARSEDVDRIRQELTRVWHLECDKIGGAERQRVSPLLPTECLCSCGTLLHLFASRAFVFAPNFLWAHVDEKRGKILMPIILSISCDLQ